MLVPLKRAAKIIAKTVATDLLRIIPQQLNPIQHATNGELFAVRTACIIVGENPQKRAQKARVNTVILSSLEIRMPDRQVNQQHNPIKTTQTTRAASIGRYESGANNSAAGGG